MHTYMHAHQHIHTRPIFNILLLFFFNLGPFYFYYIRPHRESLRAPSPERVLLLAQAFILFLSSAGQQLQGIFPSSGAAQLYTAQELSLMDLIPEGQTAAEDSGSPDTGLSFLLHTQKSPVPMQDPGSM